MSLQNPKKLNIVIETNADFIMAMTLRDDNDEIISLAGASVSAQVRQFAEASTSIPFTVTHNGAGGRIRMSLTYEQTSQIAYSQGVYDVNVTYSNGQTVKVIEGDVIVVPGVTRPYEGQIINILAISGELPAIGHPSRLYYDFVNDRIYHWTGKEYQLMMGARGDDGVGIISIEKTDTTGLVDTYTITYTDEETSTFEVTNGADGQDGADGADGEDGNGIASIVKTDTTGLVDTYTITFTDGNSTTFTVTNGANGQNGTNGQDGADGADGADGVGIASIEKTDTSGLVDTYTITYTDGDTDTFTVTNGEDGQDGQTGQTGATGNGIASIELYSTSGLAKTYRITYTNGNHFDFVVTDGANGSCDWSDITNKPQSFYTLPAATANELGGIKVGTNLSISDGVLSATDTTYNNATTSAAGLMSANDKDKLDGIATGANNYTLPAASSNALGGVKIELSDTDLTDGVSSLEAGKIYFYYETSS